MKALEEEDSLLKGVYWVRDAGVCSGVYVLEEGRTIIDTGNMYGLTDELQDLGPLSRLERILLTHSHFDHVGGMAEIYQIAGPDLYLHAMAKEHLRLHRQPFPSFFEALDRDGKMKLLHDGDVVEGDPPLRVIHTPGHTAGDICFFDKRSGALFCGDAVLPNNVREGATILSKPDEFCGGKLQDRIESFRKLIALNVRHLMPGHGEPVLHKGGDQIKLGLFTLYRNLHEAQQEKAWVAMGFDMLQAGCLEDARQCAAKAFQLAPDAEHLPRLTERLKEAVAQSR